LPDTRSNAAHELLSHQTLWNALEVLTNTTAPVIAFDEASGTKKEITFAQLKAAIQHQKQYT
jgi:hypothetical protein